MAESNDYYKRVIISDISPSDSKVQIIGVLTEKIDDLHWELNDTTGELIVEFNNNDALLDKVRKNMTIKVLGILDWDNEDGGGGGLKLKAKISSDYSEFDLDSYIKAYMLQKQMNLL